MCVVRTWRNRSNKHMGNVKMQKISCKFVARAPLVGSQGVKGKRHLQVNLQGAPSTCNVQSGLFQTCYRSCKRHIFTRPSWIHWEENRDENGRQFVLMRLAHWFTYLSARVRKWASYSIWFALLGNSQGWGVHILSGSLTGSRPASKYMVWQILGLPLKNNPKRHFYF